MERRRPVWIAVSDLWRDTEFQDYEVEHIAEALAEPRYTKDELHEIYAFEVTPAVWSNLMTAMPAVWTGFNEDWLVGEILWVIERQRRSAALLDSQILASREKTLMRMKVSFMPSIFCRSSKGKVSVRGSSI